MARWARRGRTDAPDRQDRAEGSRRGLRRAGRAGGAGPALCAVLALLLVLAPGPGRAQGEGAGEAPVRFQVHVLAASPEPGGVEPAARRFHALLGERVRYESLELLDTRRPEVPLGSIGRVELPTGATLRFRPLDAGPRGVLVAVDLGGTAQGDFRIPRGKPLVLGGQPYRGGQLVVVLEVRN